VVAVSLENLFLVDGKSGLLPEDAALARTLHRASKPLLLGVNKIDLPQHEARIAEFHGLGFEPVRAISAEHGRGAWDTLEELVAALPDAPAPEPAGEGVRMALVGRPNVGKSSLVNRLAGGERVVVPATPPIRGSSATARCSRSSTRRDCAASAVARERRNAAAP
jgi:GTP-binding protein